MKNKAIICLEKIKKNCAKMHFLKTPKFGMQQKADIFISRISNLNSFYILTRDTESNHLMQKIENDFFWDKNTIFEILFKFSDKVK